MPKISFVVPTYNRFVWLPMCIDSLLGQTEQDTEIIVVDDCSDNMFDQTEYLMKNHYSKYPKVRYIRNEKNMGAGNSRNIGCEAAKSDIIGVVDSDDVYPDEHAENIVKWFEKNPDSELVNFPYVSIDYFENVVDEYRGEPFDVDRFLKTGEVSYFCNPASAHRKKSALEVGGYAPENDKMTDDIQFVKRWIDAGKKIDFCPGNERGEVAFGCMHRILPDSMMVKHRGFDPNWLKKKGDIQ